ncbi:MAG TPA: hypothetical protein VGJ46_11935 [Candidatus Limnocylindrales bacterium]
MSTNETQGSGQGEAVELEGGASWTTNGTEPAPTTTADSSGSPADEVDEFLASLADAMHSTASAEHARIAESTEQRRQAYLSELTAREAAEADELRETTEQDVKAIHSWADREISRIRNEREQRIASRRQELDIRLDEHHSLIAGEIEAVEAKVSAYLAELDAFFNDLGSEDDPIALARRARSRPAFPDLSATASSDSPAVETTAARDEAAPPDRHDDDSNAGVIIGGDTPMVAVMAEPAPAEEAKPSEPPGGDSTVESPVPVEAFGGSQAETGEVSSPGQISNPGEVSNPSEAESAREPVEVGADVSADARQGSGTLLQTVPTHRPMSLLSRLANNIAERSDPPR